MLFHHGSSEIIRKRKKRFCNLQNLFLWSWRDSNPRPNKQYISFLHAYSTIDFRPKTESRHPTFSLSSEIFEFQPKYLKPYFRIPISQDQTPQNRAFVEYLASLLKSSGKRLIYYTSILSCKSELFVAS